MPEQDAPAESRNTTAEWDAPPESRDAPPAVVDSEFALLLTHDVDRPYKTGQSIYYALADRDPRQLKALHPDVNPWWQFEEIMELEDSLGVRSAFYFLREQHVLERGPSDWFDPFYWVEHVGRYEIDTPEMLDVMDRLRDGGWEVGLHGSYDSYDDPDRLRLEKTMLESALGESVVGGRQHHLNNRGRETWRHHRELGLRYDASLGSSREFGFESYHPLRPFDDEFVVFPLTLMEIALPDPGDDLETAWAECERLLEEAADNEAVMSALWHPRMFHEGDFPGYREVYRRLVERALDMGAWVGSPADYYAQMDHPTGGEAHTTQSNTKITQRIADSVNRNENNTENRTEEGDGRRGDDADPTAGDDPTPVRKSHLRRVQAEDNKVKTGANSESTG